MLTAKQRELLVFIQQRLRETGVSPSFDEMKDALGLRSKSGVHRLISALEERGFLKRLPNRARALEVVREPDDQPARPPRPAGGFRPSVVQGGLSGARSADDADAEALPVLGRIAAGTPIDAIQHEQDRMSVPADMLGGGEHYVLEVQGDSMIEAGILDGDHAVIRRCEDAATGDIVVALVDEAEATLKRLRKRGGSIALEAANSAYETRIFGPDRVKVQGRLVGLIRHY